MAEEDSPGTKRRSSAGTEDDFSEEDVMAWLCVGDGEEGEPSDELSKLLDSPADSAAPTRVRFMASPYSSPVIFQSSASYVTINGNEESCGSSFSEGESSVMASVDTRGMVSVGWGMDGCDGVDWDWEESGMNEAEVASFLGEELFDPIF